VEFVIYLLGLLLVAALVAGTLLRLATVITKARVNNHPATHSFVVRNGPVYEDDLVRLMSNWRAEFWVEPYRKWNTCEDYMKEGKNPSMVCVVISVDQDQDPPVAHVVKSESHYL